MTEPAEAPQNFLQQMTGNPGAWFLAVVLAGGGGSVGSSLLTNSGDNTRLAVIEQRLDPQRSDSLTAAVAQVQADLNAMRNARDLQHEQDHFWIACKRGRPECLGLSVDEGE